MAATIDDLIKELAKTNARLDEINDTTHDTVKGIIATNIAADQAIKQEEARAKEERQRFNESKDDNVRASNLKAEVDQQQTDMLEALVRNERAKLTGETNPGDADLAHRAGVFSQIFGAGLGGIVTFMEAILVPGLVVAAFALIAASDSASDAVKQADRAMRGLAILFDHGKFGTAIRNFGKGIADGIGKMGKGIFKELLRITRRFRATIKLALRKIRGGTKLIGEVFKFISVMLRSASSSLDGALKFFGGLRRGFSAISGLSRLAAIGKGVFNAMKAIGGAARSFISMSSTFLRIMGPIKAFLRAVPFLTTILAVFDFIRGAVEGWGMGSNLWESISYALGEGFAQVARGFLLAFVGIFDLLTMGIEFLLRSIFGDAIADAYKSFMEPISGILLSIVDWVADIFSGLGHLLATGDFGPLLDTLWNGTLSILADTARALMGMWDQLLGFVKDLLIGALVGVIRGFYGLITGAIDAVASVFDSIGLGFIGNILRGISDAISGMVDLITGIMTGSVDDIWGGIVSWVGGVFSSIWEGFQYAFRNFNLFALIQGGLNLLADGLSAIGLGGIGDAVRGVADFFGTLSDTFIGLFDDIIGIVRSIGDIVSGWMDGLRRGFEGLQSFLGLRSQESIEADRAARGSTTRLATDRYVNEADRESTRAASIRARDITLDQVASANTTRRAASVDSTSRDIATTNQNSSIQIMNAVNNSSTVSNNNTSRNVYPSMVPVSQALSLT